MPSRAWTSKTRVENVPLTESNEKPSGVCFGETYNLEQTNTHKRLHQQSVLLYDFPIQTYFILLKLIQVNLFSQDKPGNTIRCANKLMGAHECIVGDMLQGYNNAVSVLLNFSDSVAVCNF